MENLKADRHASLRHRQCLQISLTDPNQNVNQNTGYRFSRRILRATILLKQREGRHARVGLDRGDACRGGDGRG